MLFQDRLTSWYRGIPDTLSPALDLHRYTRRNLHRNTFKDMPLYLGYVSRHEKIWGSVREAQGFLTLALNVRLVRFTLRPLCPQHTLEAEWAPDSVWT
jgi:hypothetical protein